MLPGRDLGHFRRPDHVQRRVLPPGGADHLLPTLRLLHGDDARLLVAMGRRFLHDVVRRHRATGRLRQSDGDDQISVAQVQRKGRWEQGALIAGIRDPGCHRTDCPTWGTVGGGLCFELFPQLMAFGDLRHCNPLQRAKHIRHCGQDSVDSTFSMKTMVNSVHIWSVDLVQVKGDSKGSSLFKSQYKRMLCLSGR